MRSPRSQNRDLGHPAVERPAVSHIWRKSAPDMGHPGMGCEGLICNSTYFVISTGGKRSGEICGFPYLAQKRARYGAPGGIFSPCCARIMVLTAHLEKNAKNLFTPVGNLVQRRREK